MTTDAKTGSFHQKGGELVAGLERCILREYFQFSGWRIAESKVAVLQQGQADQWRDHTLSYVNIVVDNDTDQNERKDG
ncbi:hypothetical protein LA080_008864 [Diaporthe eres]|nr:hypothetical protein LA080_008864 [Diaporthe eres]